MRVSDNMKYYSAIKNMNSLQQGYNDLLEKLASQKRINRPSDDPTGIMKVLSGRQTLATISQYQSNIQQGTTWISTTSTTLTAITDLLSKVKSIANDYNTETTSTQSILANQVQEMRDQILSLANSSLGGNYLFSGSVVSTEPFSDTPHSASTDSGMGEKNTYSGTIAVGGTFQGTSNKTYVVRMAADGTAGSASYQLSTDGGKTWGTASNTWGAGNVITLDDNGTSGTTADDLTLTFAAGNVGKNDVFYVKAYAAGYYKGDGQSLSLRIGPDNDADYSTPGEGTFVPKNGVGVDVFQVLSDLATAMQGNNTAGVNGLLDDLTEAQEQVEQGAALCATKQMRLDMAKSSLSSLDQNVTNMVADTENADVSQISMLLSMKKIALDSTYALAAKLGDNSILNFLQ
jgi:flagellar hook-associated protein 3 FlgL